MNQVPPTKPQTPPPAPLEGNLLIVIPIHLALGFFLLQLNPSEFFPHLLKSREETSPFDGVEIEVEDGQTWPAPNELDPDLFADPEVQRTQLRDWSLSPGGSRAAHFGEDSGTLRPGDFDRSVLESWPKVRTE